MISTDQTEPSAAPTDPPEADTSTGAEPAGAEPTGAEPTGAESAATGRGRGGARSWARPWARPAALVRRVDGMGARRFRMLLTAVAASCAILLGLGGWLGWSSWTAHGADVARAESVDAARDLVPALLSYHAASLDADVARARDLVTGPFADEYTRLLDQVVVPATRTGQLSTDARATRVAVVSAEPGQARLLVFVDQSTTSPSEPRPATTSSRATVDLTEVDGRWLVSGLQPL